MFLIEVEFNDDSSMTEHLILRRPQAIIGAGDDAHITLEDLNFLDFQILLSRDIGNKFHLDAVPIHSPQLSQYSKQCKKNNEGEALLNFGKIKIKIISLDTDLSVRDDETPDKSGLRILRQACSTRSPYLPAVKVEGGCPLPFCVSFTKDYPVTIGRNNTNSIRIDYPEVSGSHARIGYEDGKFWIEDLGSTNGTFIGQQQISGKTYFDQNTQIKIARNFFLSAIMLKESEDSDIESELRFLNQNSDNKPNYKHDFGKTAESGFIENEEVRYPALISLSPIARPARVVVKSGTTIRIGRDQSSDIWIGAPHISRMHSTVVMNDKDQVMFSDFSTNGTYYEGSVLKRGDSILITNESKKFDFGSDVIIALCFNERQEAEVFNFKEEDDSDFRLESSRIINDNRSIDELEFEEDFLVTSVPPENLKKNFVFDYTKRLKEAFSELGKFGIIMISLSICFLLVALGIILIG